MSDDRPRLRIYQPWGPHVADDGPPPEIEVREAGPPVRVVAVADVPAWVGHCLALSAAMHAVCYGLLVYLILRA